MNVETGTEAEQFPEKKYINGVFIAVHICRKPNSISRFLAAH
jgi:hypothetical protein